MIYNEFRCRGEHGTLSVSHPGQISLYTCFLVCSTCLAAPYQASCFAQPESHNLFISYSNISPAVSEHHHHRHIHCILESFSSTCYRKPQQSNRQPVQLQPCVQVNEFHHAPVDFIFTSPLNDTVLPPLRVSGDGVLREFGFKPGRGWLDAAMVWLLVACFGTLTYFFLDTAGRTGQQSLWGIWTAWVQSVKKRRQNAGNGSESGSPLAGVNQELAGKNCASLGKLLNVVQSFSRPQITSQP